MLIQTPINEAKVEAAAQAAYEESLRHYSGDPKRHPWAKLPVRVREDWKAVVRRIIAVLEH